MREFTFEDAFDVSEILDKMNVTVDINAYADAAKAGDIDNQAYIGGQLVMSVIKKLHLAKNEVIKLISDITGDDVETVKKYNIAKNKEVLTELFNSGLKDFFDSAGASDEKK
ncbi:MAG: hypothetical protein WAO24_04215 [Peptococcia bacterium]